MPGLLDAFKQYVRDALPGGALNREVTPQGLLDAASIATIPVPVVGDVTGLAADLYRMRDPQERTPLNIGLAALGALPLVPPVLSVARKGDKVADVLRAADRVPAPQEAALETARRNAVKMLGLPENNTAMDRARALGFGDNVYHGTTADVPKFDLKYYGADGIAYDTPSVFASKDTALASDYARNKYSRDISDAMRALKEFKKSNPGTLNAEYERLYDNVRDALKKGSDAGLELGVGANVMPLMVRGNLKQVDAKGAHFMQGIPEQLAKAKAEGFDGVSFSNVIDHASPATQYPTNVTTVFKPEFFRSRFAAFDPARINENDLLGRADPALLAILAGGGLLGGGAYYLSDQ